MIISQYAVSDHFAEKKMKKEITPQAQHSALYGLGFLGAAIYYISHATGFWIGVLGFLKACVWPAFLVYEALTFIAAK